MPSDEKRDDGVGYGRPQRHTRFKKGQSGNSKGRPGGAKNLSILLSEALNERVIVAENGRRTQFALPEYPTNFLEREERDQRYGKDNNDIEK